MFNPFAIKQSKELDSTILHSQDKRLKAVIEINQALVGILEIDSILELITKRLVSVLGVSFATVWIWDEDSESIYLKSVNAPKVAISFAEKILGYPISSLKFSKSNDKDRENFFLKCLLKGETLETTNFSNVATPFLTEPQSKVMQRLLGMKRAFNIPLVIRGKTVGVFGLIWKNDIVTEDDRLMIDTFANQIINAIYNSQLFQEITKQVTELTFKNRDLTSLYNLASNISKSLDPNTVAQIAVDSLPQDQSMIGAVISAITEDGKGIHSVAASQNQLSYQVQKVIGDFNQYVGYFDDPLYKNNAIMKCLELNEPQFVQDLAAYMSPPVPKQFVPIVSKILNIKSIAVYPIHERQKTTGVVAYFLKEKNFDELEENEKQLFQTYTNQISIAMENANLYRNEEVIKHNLETALEQLKEARQHEQDMIDIMGHELRTPMSIVRNALVMMNMEIGKDPIDKPKITKYIDMGLESARREVSLIETLLSATKADSKGFQLTLQKVDLVDVVHDSLVALMPEATKKGIEIKFIKPETDVLIYCDRTRIQEVSDNLVSNSIKYTPKGSIEISIAHDDKLAHVSIKDTGMGISEQDIKKLGTKFFRAQQYSPQTQPQLQTTIPPKVEAAEKIPEKISVIRPGGTGLGLYVTFSLIKLMDGKITVKSKVGEGSTFTFSMPVYTNQETVQVDRKVDVFNRK
jgi:signal transduction histidine kinase